MKLMDSLTCNLQPATGNLSPRVILAGTFLASLAPFAILELFPAQLHYVMERASYLVFHNITEFFSIMVSLSIFGVGWYSYKQSEDRHALFLSAAFLTIGLMDFMHTLANAAMPPFITPNSSNKSTQFWIAARLLSAVALLGSAFVYPEGRSRWLSKGALIAGAVGLSGLAFTGVTFFPSQVPATFVVGVGLTPFKKVSEYLVVLLLIVAFMAYWKRMAKTGDTHLVYFLAAFVISIFSELVFASYRTVFDTYNVLGHVYKTVAFYLIYRGIFATSVKRPYAALSNANEKLRAEIEERQRAEERLRTYATRLEQSNRDLEDFAHVASHDLQEPLRKIQTFSDLLAGEGPEPLDDKARGYLVRMQRSAERMQSLVQDLLRYSRVASKAEPFTRFPLSNAAKEAVTDLAVPRGETGARIEIDDLPEVEADSVQMRQLFQNLIGNALKYCGKRKPLVKVRGTSSPSDPVVEIHVQDNGIGFGEEYLEKIFKPFQRLHGKTSPYEGTGMGLAICRRIVERHGGSITARSRPGEGSTFIVRLPKKQ
ncbi:MAG: MASE3 domain-containing protein [Thermodesulfobacteriota bacterium]